VSSPDHSHRLAGTAIAIVIAFAAGIALDSNGHAWEKETAAQKLATDVARCEDPRNGTNTARLTRAGAIECHNFQTRLPEAELFEPFKPSKRELRRILIRHNKMQQAAR
jgi:hypothetical protein